MFLVPFGKISDIYGRKTIFLYGIVIFSLSSLIISMGIAMMIFAISIGPVEITPEYYLQFISSLHYAFILFTIFCIIGTFASLVEGKKLQLS